ncbi:hypothetical protein [Flavisolibacter ginsenosidimutans]|uniref:Uncharacterized protein n=1 Tax=Flavisolibacter ginsenosidimutans TaxID=661481 RepID=A0A5B8UJ16_9BACT|nr:hypothetical protein [Flavisolibacter ginsenosidimutans]QEC56386.1 hypothetical protein FSB75_10950 [Flavisolibacter ginsenosidimutans]
MTVEEYLAIEVLVEKFICEVSGVSTLTEYKSTKDKFSIHSANYTTTLAEPYRDVVFGTIKNPA